MLKVFKCIAFWLVFIGALNWGFVGLFNFNLVSFIFGDMTMWTRIIYSIVGLSALIYGLVLFLSDKKECEY